MNAVRLIIRKRRGEELTPDDIGSLVSAYAGGDVPDYQMSAFLMAVLWRGMTDGETVALTRAMIDSGTVITYPDLHPTVDKHSTGGVGDKVSIVLAPLAAACDVYVPMLSGRGLGHTGGTLDKLESIPGFVTDLDTERFQRILRDVGCVMGGQSADLAPADGKIYALRDATGTVESPPLIVSSILSKKIAAGPESLVFDVKVGRGAFMPTRRAASDLAQRLVRTGAAFGKPILAFVTNMDVPLGRGIGNAIEVVECLDMLERRPVSEDLAMLTTLLASAMLVTSGRAPTLVEAREEVESGLASGRAAERFERLVRAHGGDAAALDRRALPAAERTIRVASPAAGVVADVDPFALATLVTDLGGGRRVMSDAIDPAVGIWLDARPGDHVGRGDALATVHVNGSWDESELGEHVRRAFRIDEDAPRSELVYEVVGPRGRVPWSGWETALPL